MVARPGTFQASHNAGELAPELHGRTDIKQFYSGLAHALNIEPVPQGGARVSPRSRHLGKLRTGVSAIAISNASDFPGPHSGAATLAQRDFAAPRPLNIALIVLSASQALGAIIQAEWNDGATWQPFGAVFRVGTAAKQYTSALAPGQSVAAAGIRWRMVSAPPSATTFAIASANHYEETGGYGVARVRAFTFALDQTYVAVFTPGLADFYRDGSWTGSAFTPFDTAQLANLDVVQRLDTMLLFHPDVGPLRIMRNGSDAEWPADSLPFTNVPQADLGGSYSATPDYWRVFLVFPTSGGSDFLGGKNLYVEFNVNGETTPGVYTGSPVDWTAFATAAKAAIEALPSVAAGITVTISVGSTNVQLDVSFTGTGNGGPFAFFARVLNTAEAAAVNVHVQAGIAGGEALISTAAGWPACGGFYQDRLFLGGFKSKRGGLLCSITAEYFDLNTEIAAASGAILLNLDTEGAERVQRLARARHLVIFTSDAEYFISDRAISRTQTPNIVASSRNGSAPGVPVVESENSLLYVAPDKGTADRKGVLVYAATFDDVAQSYVSTPISLLASHIATGIIDAALQRSASASIADKLWLVRDDGTMAAGVLIRNQDVNAFVRWATSGAVQSVCVDGKNVPHLVVQRLVDGAQELHLERLEHALIFDATVTVTNAPASATVSGLTMHEGAQVWARADGYVVGPCTVAAGSITIPFAATTIDVGRWTAPLARTLPLPSEVADKVVLRRPKRVHTVRADLIDTTSLAIGANGEAAEDVPLYFAGDATDTPPAPYSGSIDVTGLVGFTDEGQVEITQLKPGALQWRGLVIEARS